MSRDVHEQARELIAIGGTERLSGDCTSWLQSHLRDCAPCRNFEEAAGTVIRALRSQPLTTDPFLVQAAQRRVHAHALERQQRQERIHLVTLSCLLVGLLTALSTPLFYQIFKWVGAWAGAPNWVWQTGLLFASVVPALLASAVLLARGVHLTNGAAEISERW